MWIKRIVKSGILFSLAAYLSACSQAPASSEKSEEMQAELELEVSRPLMQRPVYTVQLPGQLQPYEQVELHAKTSGFIKRIFAERGDQVKKGALLAIIEAPEMSHETAAAAQRQNKANQEHLHATQIYERLLTASATPGAVSELELERALSDVKRSSAELEAAKAQSHTSSQLESYLRVTAPFDGVITRRNLSEGALVSGNQTPLFHLAQNRKLRLNIAIPERYAPAVADSAKLTFRVSGQPVKLFTARLSRKGQLIDPDAKAMLAEFDVENGRLELSGGEYAQAELSLQNPYPTAWLPVSSIVRAQAGTFVWQVSPEHTLHKVLVSTGEQLRGMIEVFGLPEPQQKQIAVHGSEEYSEGQKIKPKEASAGSEA